MKKFLLTGLIILLPLAITLAFLRFLIDFLTAPFINLVKDLFNEIHLIDQDFLWFPSDKIILYLSKILILIALFFGVALIGLLGRWFIIRQFFGLGEQILNKIPIVNSIYHATREVTKTLLKPDTTAFKQVVLVPFPHPNSYALGLISQKTTIVKNNEDLITVLIPTTPNPTSGFLLIAPKKDLVYLDIRPEEAIKYVISCGVLTPTTKTLS